MEFVRAWRRRALSAAGAGIALPGVVLVAALLVGVAGGGLGGLGALSQAFSGPEIPEAQAALDRPARTGRDATSELLADAGRAAARREAPAAAEPRGGGGGTEGRPGGRAPAGPGTQPPATPPGSSPPPGSAPPPASPPPPAAQPSPSVVRQVGDQANEVVRPVPVVGEPAAQVIDTLVDTVDELPPLIGP